MNWKRINDFIMNCMFWKNSNKEEIKNIEKRKIKFPCSSDNCLVRMTCSQACDKIEMDDNKLMKLFMKYNACPDCGCQSFMEGPHGGAAVNVKCNGCGHWFNFALPLFIQRIRIDKSTGKFTR